MSGIEKHDEMLELFYRTRWTGSESLHVEAVAMAVGWVPNSDVVGLDGVGVELDRGGYVVVDEFLRTSVPHILAAGDINGRMMLVQSSSYEGRIAADNAVLGPTRPYEHRIVPHGGFTDPDYGSVGLTEEQARVDHEVVVAAVPYADLDRAVIDDRTEGSCKLIVDAENPRDSGGAHHRGTGVGSD